MAARRDSRQLIVQAAGREFGRHGFAGARVALIAHPAGVNKQLIFYYFHSKAGLFEAILRSLADTILGSAAAADDAVARANDAFFAAARAEFLGDAPAEINRLREDCLAYLKAAG